MKGLSLEIQKKIFEHHKAGQGPWNGRKYRYAVQYHPLSAVHTWIVRQKLTGGDWEWVQPLDESIS